MGHYLFPLLVLKHPATSETSFGISHLEGPSWNDSRMVACFAVPDGWNYYCDFQGLVGSVDWCLLAAPKSYSNFGSWGI